MVKVIYRTIDKQEFTDKKEAEAHELVLQNKKMFSAKLSALGFDASAVELFAQEAFAVYKILNTVFSKHPSLIDDDYDGDEDG